MNPIQVKICGLTNAGHVMTALDNGADFIGFMNLGKSPRHISSKDARQLAMLAAGRAKTVSIMVDPHDEMITEVLDDLQPDYVQLHGAETPQFCAHVRSRGVGVIKAFGISQASDLDQIQPYLDSTEMILFDAKPPAGESITGGLGHVFDWNILSGFTTTVPWFLSGGLTVANVAHAINVTGAKMVDVSSGVERARGLKEDALIAAFMAAVKTDR